MKALSKFAKSVLIQRIEADGIHIKNLEAKVTEQSQYIAQLQEKITKIGGELIAKDAALDKLALEFANRDCIQCPLYLKVCGGRETVKCQQAVREWAEGNEKAPD